MRTVKVRIYVVVNEHEDWGSAGWSCGGPSDDDLRSSAGLVMPVDALERGYWLTAELPVPERAPEAEMAAEVQDDV